MNHPSSSRTTNAFTIVELIIVVVVIAILAMVAVVAYNGVQADARDKALLSDINAVESELARYATKNGGVYGGALAWNSGSGPNANIRFSPSAGNVVTVTVSNGHYCIKAYNPKSNSKTLATAKMKASNVVACT